MKGTTWTFVIALALAAILATVATGAAVAGKGSTGATLTFSTAAGSSATTTQVAVGSKYYVNGSGFRSNKWVTVGAHYDTTYWGSGWTDAQGNITIGPFTAMNCGDIYHEGDQLNIHNGRFTQKAGATLNVPC